MQMVLIDCIEPRVRNQSTLNKCYSDRSIDFLTCFKHLGMDFGYGYSLQFGE